MSLWEMKYALICAVSWLSLLVERLWRSYWPVFSLLFAFAGLAGLGVLTFFGAAAHIVFLLLFLVAIVYFTARPRFAFRLPRQAHVRRAVERQSGLSHRPLEALTDKPVKGTSPEAVALWDKYQDRLRRYRSRLKIYRPNSGVAQRDAYALRHAALLLLAVGLFVAQGDIGFRLMNALHVDTARWIRQTPVALDAWITPPDYTGMSPVFLATTQIGARPDTLKIRVPENSLLKIRISGFSSPPRMTLGDTHPVFTNPAAQSYALEMKLKKSGTLKLTQGFFRRTLGEWPITVVPDNPPDLTLIGTEKTPQGALKINYAAKDDYGLKKITGTVAPGPEIARALGGGPFDFDIPVATNDNNIFDHVEDLTDNPFAGSKVTLTLTAEDDAGNKTTSAPLTLVLPERVFNNPVARRIAAERKRLIWYNNALTQVVVKRELADIAQQPLGYHYDTRVFLGLDVAVKRLIYEGGDKEAVNSLVPLLWNLALRVEDGGLSMAGRDLSDALQRLSEGLKNKNISKAEMDALMDDVRQKMRQYVKTLATEMRSRMQEGKNIPTLSPELARKFMKHIDMGKMLREMQQLSQGGSREQMQKMAEYLKKSVDNLDLNRMEKMQESQRQQIKALNDLQKLIERQQSLLDKTNKMPQDPNRRQQPQQQAQQNPQQGQQPDKKQSQGQGQDQGAQQPQESQNGQSQQAQNGAQQNAQHGQRGQEQSAADAGAQSAQQGSRQNGNQGGSQGSGHMPPQPAPAQGGTQRQQTAQGQMTPEHGGQQRQDNHQDNNAGGNGAMPPQPAPDQSGYQSAQTGPNGQPQDTQTGQNGMPQPVPGQQGLPLPDPQGQNGKIQNARDGQMQNAHGQPDSTQPQTAAGQRNGQTGDGIGGQKQGKRLAGNGGAPDENPDENEAPPQDISTPREGAAEQQKIRGKLGAIMRALGEDMPEVPANFGRSDQAMEQSQKSLAGGAPRAAGPAQKQALDELQKGLDKTMEAMAKRMQQSVMTFGEGGGEGFGMGFDPLGRQMGNQDGNGATGLQDIQLPDGKEQRRVQQIIKELRARSNDYRRPKVERDYIDRLLDQFN
jgi:uncharacterized protein (TIGR02302 family)